MKLIELNAEICLQLRALSIFYGIGGKRSRSVASCGQGFDQFTNGKRGVSSTGNNEHLLLCSRHVVHTDER